MSGLKKWEQKLIQSSKNMFYRDAVKYLCSRAPLSLYKVNGKVSRIHNGREKNLIGPYEYEELRDTLLTNGVQYSGDLFDDFINLSNKIPKSYISAFQNPENAEYADMVTGGKDLYLTFVPVRCRNTMYSFNTKNSNDVLGSVSVYDGSSIVYNSRLVQNSYKIFFSSGIISCSEIFFSTNLQNCNYCWNCSQLENKSYCIDNIQYSENDYFERFKTLKKQMLMNQDINQRFDKVNNFGSNNCENCSGCIKCNELLDSMYAYQINNGKNVLFCSSSSGSKDFYNVFLTGSAENVYTIMFAGGNINNAYYCLDSANCSNVYYSMGLEGCSYCLACYGLKNKSYCILNKQYSKEERFILANKIFSKMENDGILGNFFPGELNPFYFNDTVAYQIDDSFTKEEVTKDGYLRRDEEIKVDIPEGSEIIATTPVGAAYMLLNDMPDKTISDFQGFDEEGNWKIDSEILKKVIVDEKGDYYRIMPMELEFLRKYELPLPEIHWLDRIKLGFKFNHRNSSQLAGG